MQLTKVTKTGEWAFNVFKDEQGRMIEEETSLEAYDLLGGVNPTNPTKEGYSWAFSYKGDKFDTTDGKLRSGQYCESGDNRLVKLDGSEHVFTVQKNLIVDDILEDALASEMVNSGDYMKVWQ